MTDLIAMACVSVFTGIMLCLVLVAAALTEPAAGIIRRLRGTGRPAGGPGSPRPGRPDPGQAKPPA